MQAPKLIDWLKFNRAGYLWSVTFNLLAGLVTVKAYHNWKHKQETPNDKSMPERLAETIL